MANNRIELATLPRFLTSPLGKTISAEDDVSILLETGGVCHIFQAANTGTGTQSTAISQATASLTDNTNYAQYADNSLVLVIEFSVGVTDAGGFSPSWYIVKSGATRTADRLERLGTDTVDLTVAQTTDDTTTLNTYSLTIDGVTDATTIPIATWAQDGTTVIPRAKLPDVSYGDQFFFRSNADRNAGFPSFTSAANARSSTGGTTMLTITWHQNDVAIVISNAGMSSESQQAFLYIGADQPAPAVTTDADWLTFGTVITLSKFSMYLTVINRSQVTTPVAGFNTTTYTITNVGGQDIITFNATDFSLPLTINLAINGVNLIEGIDYEINTNRNVMTFTSSANDGWTFPTSGTDTVQLFGVVL